MGTLNSVVICFLGVQAGRTLMQFRGRHAAVLFRFTVWGVLLVREGYILLVVVGKLLAVSKCFVN